MRRALLWLLVAAVLLSPALLPLRQRLVLVGRPLGSALYRLGLATSPFRSPTGDSDGLEQKSEIIRLGAENQALRQQLNLDASSPFPTLAAEITGRVNDPASRSVIINRGRRDGLAEGMAVMSAGYLVGKVSRTESTFSEVQLITDPKFRLTVTAGQAPTPGLATGSLGGMRLERLLKTEPVNDGDEVLSSDAGGQVPSGLPVGAVTNVRPHDAVFYSAAIVTPEGRPMTMRGRGQITPYWACRRATKLLSISSVISKSLTTPSIRGRAATTPWGVLPTICLAGRPMAITCCVRLFMATTLGSSMTMPRPRT